MEGGGARAPVSPLRRAVGVVGELAITFGLILVLFVIWQLGFVAVVVNRGQAEVVLSLEHDFLTSDQDRPSEAQGFAPQRHSGDGDAFAVLRIPRLGGDTWAKPVYQGVALSVLAKGMGHYEQTQSPGGIGNMAIAGHRAGHGNPLIDIDAIVSGDVVVVETRAAFFVYRAVQHVIVEPTDVAVLAPVPGHPGAVPTKPWLTLTTCDPRYGSSHRYIVFALLDETIPHERGIPAQLLTDPAGKI